MPRNHNPTDDAVLSVLAGSATPLSAYQVLAALKGRGVQSPPVVYRALDRLARAGRVHRLEQANAYFVCDHDHAGDPVVFAVCDACGRVAEWPADDLEGPLAAKAEEAGFRVAGRTLEVRGLCGDCVDPEVP